VILYKQEEIIARNIDKDDTKRDILEHIYKTPGIRYKELLRLTRLKNGVLSYHLTILEKLNKIRIDRQNNRVTRYYIVDITKEDSDIIGCFRNRVTRKIAIFILQHDSCIFNEIVDHINKAPSTVSWHLKRLRNAGIISVTSGEKHHLYRVVDGEVVGNILYKYKESFVDKVVDNYTEMMEEL
jgi:predicted transcriptional regulator